MQSLTPSKHPKRRPRWRGREFCSPSVIAPRAASAVEAAEAVEAEGVAPPEGPEENETAEPAASDGDKEAPMSRASFPKSSDVAATLPPDAPGKQVTLTPRSAKVKQNNSRLKGKVNRAVSQFSSDDRVLPKRVAAWEHAGICSACCLLTALFYSSTTFIEDAIILA